MSVKRKHRSSSVALFLAAGQAERDRASALASAYGASGTWLQPVGTASASSIAGLPLRVGGLLFRDALTIDLSTILDELANHPLIERTQLSSAHESNSVPVILATGVAANSAAGAHYLELLPVWGQVEQLTLRGGPALPISAGSVVTPTPNGYAVGASYEQAPWPAEQAHRFNLDRLADWWKRCVRSPLQYAALGHFRGCRAVTSDRQPVIGALHDEAGEPLLDRWVTTGHGSHGTLSAPLAADCLASAIDGEASILSPREAATVEGQRFRERQSRRGLRHGARAR